MPKTKNIVIIVAAGTGSRLGSEIPKQFLLLNGREILSYSIETFMQHSKIDRVIIVTSEQYLDHVKSNYPDCMVVLGGSTRQESVYNGMQNCTEDTLNILIHDAARPLIRARVIDDCLNALDEYDGTAPAINPSDSMIQLVDGGFLNLDRDSLRIVQTPQCFRFDILKQAHASSFRDTDEIGLVKQALPKANLYFVEGAGESMKITESKDIKIVELYLSLT